MKGNREMKKHNNGNSSADLFNRIKLEMFRKIHGLSEKEAKAKLAKAERTSRKVVSRSKIGSEEKMITAEEFFGDWD